MSEPLTAWRMVHKVGSANSENPFEDTYDCRPWGDGAA
jgi:hypothetical protein